MSSKHTFIFKGGRRGKTKSITGMSGIREKCFESSNWQCKEIEYCQLKAVLCTRSDLAGSRRTWVDGGAPTKAALTQIYDTAKPVTTNGRN